jgi:hypothetical protein
LINALRKASLAELNDHPTRESKSLDVLSELESRVQDAHDGYPFTLSHDGVLNFEGNHWRHFVPYIFCLLASYLTLPSGDDGYRLFEKLSYVVAREYLQGSAVRFGAPREKLPGSFPDAVDVLCERMGEGEGFGSSPPEDVKDDLIDIVAWKDFADLLPSKVLMFGQCATGSNWRTKKALKANNFCNHWMKKDTFSPGPIPSFFCSHRVKIFDYEKDVKDFGVFFERCRISSLGSASSESFPEHEEWLRRKLETITAQV